MEEEVSLVRKLLIFWEGRKIIIYVTLVFAVLSVAYALHVPPIYKAECYFLPPNYYMNKLGVFANGMNQNDLTGSVSDASGFPNTVTIGQMLLGVMKRNAVLDIIIDKFSLMEVYEQASRVKMRDMLLRKLMETNEDPKSGIITVGILDEDPKRAADIANTIVDTLQGKMLELSKIDAMQRRSFFEKQLFQAWQYMNDIQNEMVNYQAQLGGVAIPQSQLEATLRSITELRQQIADKNVEISALKAYATPNNPRLKAAYSQLDTLTKELARLEEVQRSSSPHLSIEYQRHEMRLRYATEKYQLILQQVEDAKMDESQGFFQIQVVDYATPPDAKYKPSRARIVILGTFVGLLLGCGWVLFSSFAKGFKKSIKNCLADNPNLLAADDEDDDAEADEDSDSRTKTSDSRTKTSVLSHILSLMPALLCMAVILLLTFQPVPASGQLSGKFQNVLGTLFGLENLPAWILDMQLLRAFIHIFLYLPFGLSVYYAFRSYGIPVGKAAFSALVIASAFGLADEAIKMFLPGREFDVIDWIFDVVGISVGILLALLCKLCAALIHRVINRS